MRGHQPIIAMRRRGVGPAAVFFDTDTFDTRMWRDWHLHTPAVATVQIDPDDIAAALDLRFAAGLVVHVTGGDHARVDAVSEALREQLASRVISVYFGGLHGLTVQAMTDTAGEFTWPN